MKNKKMVKEKFNTLEVIFLIIITSIISLIMGYFISKPSSQKNENKNLNEFIKTYKEITSKYYKKINEEDLLNGAVNGMLSTLDKHSVLIDKNENESFYLMLDGSYEGVGIEVTQYENKIVVIGVIENSPASEAGIKLGDVILKVDDINMESKTTTDVSNYIRKNSNKMEFNILIDRDGEKINFNVKKKNVVIKSVTSKIIERDEHKIGYIYISIFSNTTASQFAKELNKLEKENIEGIIIDVRENTGGHLSTAVSILSMLLNNDKVMYQIDKNDKKTKYYSIGDKDYNKPIVILQNSNSASAAEMLSVSLKDNLSAIVIGETTYGKGTVQEYNYLSNGNMYKYTTKKWLSPKGKSVDEKGIKPNIEISLDENYYNNPTDDTDNQLQTAIQTILDKINN